MYSQPVDIYALDKDMRLLEVNIPYDNLQWTRRYYECGEFVMQVDINTFNPDWAYIGTTSRPELGMVQKVNTFGEGKGKVLVCGLFLEGMLRDKVIYPRLKATYPTAEQAARDVFNRFKRDIPIQLGEANSPMLGQKVDVDIADDEMAEKVYAILEKSELSYRCRYDYETEGIFFEVWQGKDRTSSQSENPYQTFSTQFGNIGDKDINLDDSDYKNYAIVPVNADDDDREQDTFYIDWSNGGYQYQIVFDYRSSRPETDENGNPTNYAQFKAETLEDAAERLMAYARIEDIDVTLLSDQGYMVDFDLGDKCDVILDDVGISMETRIVEVSEVFKTGQEGHTITVGLGNKRVANIRRLINRL